MSKLPILIVIPHGGYRIPEELEDHTDIEEGDLILSADTGANELFAMENCSAVLSTHISRLFVDLNRSPLELPPRCEQGVMKSKSFWGVPLFHPDQFPDSIAVSNLLRRYYFPFQDTMRKIIGTGEIHLIVECHTVGAIGGIYSADRDKPRPVVSIQRQFLSNDRVMESCPLEIAETFLASFRKNFDDADCVSEPPFAISEKPMTGSLVLEHAKTLPYMRINLSRGLFLNDIYFSFDYGKLDQIHLSSIQKKVAASITKASTRLF
jgi:hypothetical protein